jgi:hypothetical protein
VIIFSSSFALRSFLPPTRPRIHARLQELTHTHCGRWCRFSHRTWPYCAIVASTSTTMRRSSLVVLCAFLLLVNTTAVIRCQADDAANTLSAGVNPSDSNPPSPWTSWWHYVAEEHVQPSLDRVVGWAEQIWQACKPLAQTIGTSVGKLHDLLPSPSPLRGVFTMPPLLLRGMDTSSLFLRTNWLALPIPTLPLPSCKVCRDWLDGVSDWLSTVDATLVATANCTTCQTTPIQSIQPIQDTANVTLTPPVAVAPVHNRTSSPTIIELPLPLPPPQQEQRQVYVLRARQPGVRNDSSQQQPSAPPVVVWKNASSFHAETDLWVDRRAQRWVETRKVVGRPTLTVLLAEYHQYPSVYESPVQKAMVLQQNDTWQWFLIDDEQPTSINPTTDVRATALLSLWTQLINTPGQLARLANFTIEQLTEAAVPTTTSDEQPVEVAGQSAFKRLVLSMIAAWLTMTLFREWRLTKHRSNAASSNGQGRLPRSLQIRKRRSAEALPPPPRYAKQQRSPARPTSQPSPQADGVAVFFPPAAIASS